MCVCWGGGLLLLDVVTQVIGGTVRLQHLCSCDV
jgi:hypothetical protein